MAAGNAYFVAGPEPQRETIDAPLFDLSNLAPGDSSAACLTIDEDDPGLRLYGRTGGTGLEDHLEVRVTAGEGKSCSGFRPDRNRGGKKGKKGVLFEGELSEFPTTFSDGIVDTRDGEQKGYQIEVELPQEATEPMGADATLDLIWESRPPPASTPDDPLGETLP